MDDIPGEQVEQILSPHIAYATFGSYSVPKISPSFMCTSNRYGVVMGVERDSLFAFKLPVDNSPIEPIKVPIQFCSGISGIALSPTESTLAIILPTKIELVNLALLLSLVYIYICFCPNW